MKKISQLILGFGVMLFCSPNLNSQTIYANREWVRETPAVGTGIYHTSTIVVSGKVYVTGNIINSSGNTDIYTIKLDSNGDTLWSKTYNGSATGSMDYGIELQTSSDGYLYVIGAAQNSSSGYDYCLIKYSQLNGTQVWVRNWNGVGNGDDIPSAMKVDGSSAIYVTGGSEATNGFSDYGTIKVSNLNVLNWAKYYNYNGLHDGATTISTNLTDVIVSGGSASASNDWDIATIKYSKFSGSSGTPSRTNIPGATMVAANAMITDSLNNIYITGYAEVSGNKNIQTIKLDSNLTLKWITDYEENGDDVASDIGIDGNSNVYITGYTEVSVNKYQGITIKYQDDGDTLWTQFYGNTVTEDGVQFRKLAVDSDGEVYLTGSVLNGGSTAFAFVKYDTDGNKKVRREYEADSLNDDGFDIVVDADSVYITGFTETISGQTMTTLKFVLKEKDNTLELDSISGTPLFVQRDLIVNVDSEFIDENQINDLEKYYWSLGEIFDSGFVTNLERELEIVCDNDHCPITVYRIFTDMRTTDTISITRLGDTISIPQFWSTFVFEFPDGIDVTAASNAIVSMYPDIEYSTYNLIGRLNDVPNDTMYAEEQIGLHTDPTPTFPDFHIDAETAWEYETGKRYIKIGVMDGPVYWEHEDFGGDDESTTKVNGWDYCAIPTVSIYASPTNFIKHHSTSVCGTIGAIRNNEIGIAGIAGGSYLNGANLDSSGCALLAMDICGHSDTVVILSHSANAVYNSVVYVPGSDNNYGIHIMNNSWAVGNQPYISPVNPWFLDTNIVLLRECYHFANRNGVVVTASRGNSGYMQDAGTYHYNYPGTLDDDWIICVGGVGTDGNYHDDNVSPEGGFKTSRGPEIDVSGFSAASHNWTTQDYNGYNTFVATSAATPFATGIAGLLLSYLNSETADYNNLAPEDVEYILQMTALDCDTITNPGPDTLTGYGLVQAGAAMMQVDKDKYSLDHFGTDAFPNSTTFALYSSNDTVTLSERYQNVAGDWFLPNTDYVVDTYEITSISGHIVNFNEEIIAAWPRPSSSNVFMIYDVNNVVMPRERIILDSVDNSYGYMRGYIYFVSDTLGNPLGWWPIDTLADFDLTYSILKSDTTVFLNNEEVSQGISINVFPNPSSQTQTLILELDQPINGEIRLLDINGRVVQTIYSGNFEQGQNQFDVDVSNLPKGVYVYSIRFADGNGHFRRIIKT
ncbi:MAG: S8 family serine peptidase [Crocinitomicaceae bacterium]|nr:S8 family serine peptidase [Crocinitomicaceae bacterium]